MTDSSPQDSGPAAEQRPSAPITGVDFNEVRTGEDTRQRGWFWHWNELHTEYGPLLQHSGIGLITSYIVWTDRRESSPYRGYAFPSLQTQASFSGSDRAELMTINRILVALDLIEIRKEMVLRVDEQGHKWRVPHNLYRVKDRSGDPHLTARDVQRVLTMAEERKDVYRHIRHVLTTGFTPITRSNIWYGILEELRPSALWQRLAARAEAEEARFSARSRAGHASRKSAGDSDPARHPQPSPEPTLHALPAPALGEDAYVPGTETGSDADAISPVTGITGTGSSIPSVTVVQQSNDGLQTSVATSTEALAISGQGSVAPLNQAQPTTVAPSNAMYYQPEQTTTKREQGKGTGQGNEKEAVTNLLEAVTDVVTNGESTLSQVGEGPGIQVAPGHGPDREAALLAFAEANGRVASVAEERLLGRIVDDVTGDQGWALVGAAIYEAVDSGSAFVAPKRVREIVRRWLKDGVPAQGEIASVTVPMEAAIAEDMTKSGVRVDLTDDRQDHGFSGGPFWVTEAGLGSGQLWAAVIDLMEQMGGIRPNEVQDYLKPAVLLERTGHRSFRLGVPHELARRKIERSWLPDLETVLERLLGGNGWELKITVSGERRLVQSVG